MASSEQNPADTLHPTFPGAAQPALTPELAGRFQLVELLGGGATGTVYLARQQPNDYPVAIKFLSGGDDERTRARFQRETKLTASLHHPNVVRVFEVGELSGHLYMVIEYMEGGTLRARLRRDGRLAPRAAARVALDALAGLEACHEAGIVHRDLKPENLLFDGSGRAKVADLGIAREVEGTADLTATGAILGTPRYMAPEQVSGAASTAASDVFAIALIVHEMIVGEVPQLGANVYSVLKLRADTEIPPIHDRAPSLPDALNALLARATALDPAARPQTAAAFAAELTALLPQLPEEPVPVVGAAVPVSLTDSRGMPIRTARLERRRAPQRAAALAVGLALALVAVLAMHRPPAKQEPTRASSTPVDDSPGTATPLWEPGTLTGSPQPGLDAWGDALPAGAVARLGTLRWRSPRVRAFALSPDAAELVTAGEDGVVRVLEVASGRLRRRWSAHAGDINALALEGDVIATAGEDRAIRLWKRADGSSLGELAGHAGRVRSLAFLPGGRLASGSADATVRLWDWNAHRELANATDHQDEVCAVAASPDGRLLATAGQDRRVVLRDAATLAVRATFTGHGRAVAALAFSPDGARLASGGRDHAVKVWEVAGGRLAWSADHHGEVLGLAWSDDGTRVLSGGDDRRARLWTSTGVPAGEVSCPGGKIWCVAFLPGGRRFLTGARDNLVRAWDAATLTCEHRAGAECALGGLAVAPDGRAIATGGVDGQVLVRSAGDELAWRVAAHRAEIQALAWSPDGALVASGARDGRVRLWDAVSGAFRREWTGLEHVIALAFSPDGRLLAAGDTRNRVTLFDVGTGAVARELTGHAGNVHALAWSPDGAHLASGSRDKTAMLWEVATGRSLRALGPLRGEVSALAFLAGGARLVTATQTGQLTLWEAATGRALKQVEDPERPFESLAVLADGRIATAALEPVVRLWDPELARPPLELAGHDAPVNLVAADARGDLLSASYDTTVLIQREVGK